MLWVYYQNVAIYYYDIMNNIRQTMVQYIINNKQYVDSYVPICWYLKRLFHFFDTLSRINIFDEINGEFKRATIKFIALGKIPFP